MNKDPIRCVLVTGGKWHDFAYARGELLDLLRNDPRFEVTERGNYDGIDEIEAAQLLVTYTCDLVPPHPIQQRLRRFVERGARWLALHGTNSVLRFMEDGRVDTPDEAPLLMETLGSRFLAHPPIGRYAVRRTAIDDPLTRGIDSFEVEDELYLAEVLAPARVLLEAEFEGSTPRFTSASWPRAHHPVLYERSLGQGAVLYLTLGHCRGHGDMRPLMQHYPHIERGAWESPVFRELLVRSLSWGAAARGDA